MRNLIKKIDLQFAIILIIGIALRLYQLGSHDLWYDEASSLSFYIGHSVFLSEQPLFVIFQSLWVLPLFTFNITSRFFEFFCRLPAAFFSAACIVVVYSLVKKTISRRVALFASLFIALSTFHIWYAQEIRAYSLAVLLGLISSYFLIAWVNDYSNKKQEYLYVLFSTLSIYSHYICFFLIFAHAMYYLIIRKSFKNVYIFILPFVFFIPWSVVFIKQYSILSKGNWPALPTPEALLITLENSLLGYSGTLVTYRLFNVIVILLFCVFVYGFLREKKQKGILLFYFIIFVLPVFLTFIISKYLVSIYVDRNFLIFTPYLYIMLATAINYIRLRLLRWVVFFTVCALLAISCLRYFTDQIYQADNPKHHIGVYIKRPVRPLVVWWSKQLKEGLGGWIVFTNPAPTLPLGVYGFLLQNGTSSEDFRFIYAYDPDIYDSRIKLPNREVVPFFKKSKVGQAFYVPKEDILKAVSGSPNGRLGLIACDWPRDNKIDDNSRSIKDLFDKNFACIENYNFDGMLLYIYDVRIRNKNESL